MCEEAPNHVNFYVLYHFINVVCFCVCSRLLSQCDFPQQIFPMYTLCEGNQFADWLAKCGALHHDKLHIYIGSMKLVFLLNGVNLYVCLIVSRF